MTAEDPPTTAQSVTFSVRMPTSLRDRLQAAARRERRSTNNLILLILEGWLDEDEAG
jgi:predicted HicB family RNase H-like nuclease